MRRVISSSIATELVRSGLGGLQILVLALGLGATTFGGYSAAFAAGAILQPLVYAAAVYWLQPYLRDPSKFNASVSHLVLCSVITSVAVLPFVALVVGSSGIASVRSIYILLLGEVGASLLMHHLSLVMLGIRRLRSYFIWSSLLGMARLLCAVAVIVLPVDDQLIALGVGQMVAVLVLVLSYLLIYRWQPGGWTIAFRDNRERMWGFGLVGFLQALIDQVDKIVLAFVMPAAVVGVVAMATRFNAYALIPSRGYSLAMYPRLFDAAERSPDSVIELSGKIGRNGAIMTFATALPVLSLVFLFERFFGLGFEGLFPVAGLLMIRYIVRPVSYAFGDGVYALRNAGERVKALLVTTVLYVGGLLILVPIGGIWMLVVVGIVIEVLNMLLLFVGVRRASLR